MATATKKISPGIVPHRRAGRNASRSPSLFDRFARGFDAIYRFLASLKLAVFSISTLAATLAYATFFESWYGGGAAQEYIYRSPGFAILLAFLGMNILCAALIRYPVEEAADRVRGHSRRAADPAGSARITACGPPTRDRSACSRGTSRASWSASTIP